MSKIYKTITALKNGKVMVLDAPSGFGKTCSLLKMKNKNPEGMLILSYEVLVSDICRCLKNTSKDTSFMRMLEKFEHYGIIAIEDIDFLKGKYSTLAYISTLVNKITEHTTSVVITGIDIYEKMPGFVDSLNNSTYIKFS